MADADRERFSAACRQVLSFANKYFYSEKLDWDKLKAYHQSSGNYYFLSEIAHLYYSTHANYNFRLSNLHAYTAYVLPEHKFREGVVLFEDEPDVDKFIRNHNLIAMEKWSF